MVFGFVGRAELLAVFGDRYSASCRSLPGLCVYCGAAASTVDHVPAVSRVEQSSEWLPHVVYPACRSCNSRIGAASALCLVDRARLVAVPLSADALQSVCECLRCQPRPVVPAGLFALRASDAREFEREAAREARFFSRVPAPRLRRGWDDARSVLACSGSGFGTSEADLQAFRLRFERRGGDYE